MPSKSPAQARLMAAVAHNPTFAKKVGIPQSVGEDFNNADEGTEAFKPAKPPSAPMTAPKAAAMVKVLRGPRTYRSVT